jgi:hypothetical protein
MAYLQVFQPLMACNTNSVIAAETSSDATVTQSLETVFGCNSPGTVRELLDNLLIQM